MGCFSYGGWGSAMEPAHSLVWVNRSPGVPKVRSCVTKPAPVRAGPGEQAFLCGGHRLCVCVHVCVCMWCNDSLTDAAVKQKQTDFLPEPGTNRALCRPQRFRGEFAVSSFSSCRALMIGIQINHNVYQFGQKFPSKIPWRVFCGRLISWDYFNRQKI